MTDTALSIVIPYKQRLDNIRAVFTSLTEQTLPADRFEVVVGAMEYDPAYTALCAEFTGRLRIVSVHTAEDWNTSRARNLAIGQASGTVVVVLDADVALAPDALRNLWERHYQHGQNVCVQGEVFGYDAVIDDDVDSVETQPYEVFRAAFGRLDESGAGRDPRWTAAYASAFARFPWAFVRTGLMALPAATIRRHGLLLDEGFLGWGAEDQEWGLRIARTGTPIVLGQGVRGIHLPHRRDFAAQDRSATLTNRYYLAKWPRLDLELALAFGGWLEADRHYPEARRELAAAAPGQRLGVVVGAVDGTRLLLAGVLLSPDGQTGPDGRPLVVDPEAEALFGPGGQSAYEHVLPLAGFALPFEDGSVDAYCLLPRVDRLTAPYRDAVRREAGRVALRALPAQAAAAA
ncbi:glycosyltransferase family 2 protein [Streptomyces sp. NPDC090077]|uniref:glycosyltransferase family 2 protein n=1 Tax=Streptomyces sp. NPDC090077 TaxID=3365938 RepID=UPI00382F9801